MNKAPMQRYSAELKERVVKLAIETKPPMAQTDGDLGGHEHTFQT